MFLGNSAQVKERKDVGDALIAKERVKCSHVIENKRRELWGLTLFLGKSAQVEERKEVGDSRLAED